ncbi:ubiquinone biosynthesis protein COQ9, mitochondrial [Cochliomyia hominivorax]
MANLTALNRFIKLQQILNNRNVKLSHQFACRTLATTNPLNSSRGITQEKQEILKRTQQQEAFKSQLQITDHRTFCTKKDSATTTSIEEFRAREEKREEEFEQQQKDKAQQEEDERNVKVEAIRVKILEAALRHVPTLGWTRNAIVQGAEEAGYPSVVHGMFPEGGFDLVSYFNGKCNEELLKMLQQETDNGTKEITNPLEFLVRYVRIRLEMIVPYKGQWPQAIAQIAMPQNASTALAQVLTLVDDICYYSGDRSVDIGWYTRRIGLATILKMTELYMMQDNSPNHSKTWEFLHDRMDEAVQLQMVLQQTEDVKHNFQRSFNSAFITARNILGLNYNRP